MGSFWQVIDRHSAEVAKDVYSWILKGKNGFDARRYAQGLHKPVRDLREGTCYMMKHDRNMFHFDVRYLNSPMTALDASRIPCFSARSNLTERLMHKN